MFATVPSATLLGVEGRPVTVEVHVGVGLPGFTIVGLPDAACRESRDRVRASVQSSRLPWPDKRITVNLAPSAVRKVGSGLDLAMAVGVLVASGSLPAESAAGRSFIGELGLDGSVRSVAGMVPLVDAIPDGSQVVVAISGGREARVAGRHRVRTISSLSELVPVLLGEEPWPDHPDPPPGPDPAPFPDLADVRGHTVARQAVEVAAAGGHHLLLVGPPGAGKTMLARRLPGLLPPLDDHDARLATRIHSAAGLGLPGDGLVRRAPFRAPHHTSSMVSMIGGGTASMRPGETSCSHGGCLFLDELGEFAPSTLDSLRQPLEEGVVRVARARAAVTFPARFLLVGSMNPCPCGEAGPGNRCRCAESARARYRRRLSGPLLDRFDLRVRVDRPDVADLLGGTPGEATATVGERVSQARARAQERGARCNAELPSAHLEEATPLAPGARDLLESALRRGALSARGLQRIRRVALTLADLRGREGPLDADLVGLALGLRADVVPTDHAAAV